MRRRAFLRASILTLGGAAAASPLAAAPGAGALLGPWSHVPVGRPRGRAGEIRLSSNENPLGISPRAKDAILEGIPEANRYPFEVKNALAEALANLHDMPRESILLTNGSTEVIQVVVQALRSPGFRIVVADPTFEDIVEFAEPQGTEVVRVPLTADHAHDLPAMERAAGETGSPCLVYICNPNNPTGTLTSSAAVDEWIARAPDNIYFLVDEAYFEFVGNPSYHSCLEWTRENPRVLVARTFSKVHGMAGMRLGYGVGHPSLMEVLRPWTPSTNTNNLALVAARASLADPVHVHESLRVNTEGKEILLETLADLDLGALPSHTNFVMHEIRGDLGDYRRRMREAGFLVGRPFPPYLEYNRLSLGLPEEMTAFAATLRDFRVRGWV